MYIVPEMNQNGYSVVRLVCTVLPVSLDCPFLIAPSTKDAELDQPITLLDSQITHVSFQTVLHCLVCQILHETFFQIINMYSIGGQDRASELL